MHDKSSGRLVEVVGLHPQANAWPARSECGLQQGEGAARPAHHACLGVGETCNSCDQMGRWNECILCYL